MNNIQYQTIYSTQIYLASSNADILINKTSKSNVVFYFADALKIEKNAIETRVSVVDAQIPVSWYLINDTNNQLTIGSTTYTFTNGNYDVNGFINLWASVVGDTTKWKITFNSATSKFQFQNLITNNFSFSDTNINSIYKIIGFQAEVVYTSTNGYLTSPYVVNFAGINKVNIKSSTFLLKNIDAKNKGKTRTIASVPVNTSSNGIIYYNNFTQYKSIFRNYELSSIGIEFQDDNKNYIDFNNVDWNLTIQIDVVCEVIENLDTLEDVYNNNIF